MLKRCLIFVRFSLSFCFYVFPTRTVLGGADGEEDPERRALLPQAPSSSQGHQAGELVVGAPGGRRRAAGEANLNTASVGRCCLVFSSGSSRSSRSSSTI